MSNSEEASKVMVIGLGPEYNYPNNINEWSGKNNTRYASNHGASLISRTLIKHFNADYVDNFSNIELLNEKYDQCIIAFATHLTNKRDVSIYTNVIEKLKMPVHLFSLGVQDYIGGLNKNWRVHPSMHRLLEIVSNRTKVIGCRGPHTAELIHRSGIKNVETIGCPTFYYNLNRDFKIKKNGFKDPAVVFHRTFATGENLHLLEGVPIVGQDFLDEVVFCLHSKTDRNFRSYELRLWEKQKNYLKSLKLVQNQGIFHFKFKEWFDFIGSRGFVFGPRLHGCIGSMIQGIPAVMTARDLRVREMGEMFNVPCLSYDEVGQFESVKSIYDWADYSNFNKNYPHLLDSYLSLIKKNGLTVHSS